MAVYLQKGDKGTAVGQWQTWLRSRKIDLAIDNDFGEKTKGATKLWQFRARIPETGIVDDTTLEAARELGFADHISSKPIQEYLPPESDHVFEGTGNTRVDKINSAALALVAPAVRMRVEMFLSKAKSAGTIIQVVQGMRTFAEQHALYKIGRRGIKGERKVTNAEAGQSLHNYGLAVDVAPVVNGTVSWDEHLYSPFGGWATASGLEWGGAWQSFKDLPHLQDDEGMTLKQVQQVYAREGLGGLWSKIK